MSAMIAASQADTLVCGARSGGPPILPTIAVTASLADSANTVGI